MQISRRQLLTSTALGLLSISSAKARIISGGLPWKPDAGAPPEPIQPGGWKFFTPEEGATIEALVDRLIPPDPQTPGGKDAGCAVFIDRQLAGSFGAARALYMRPPFLEAAPGQPPQHAMTPAQRYRAALAALDKHCQTAFAGKRFVEISDEQKDELLTQMEKGPLRLEGVSATGFFQLLLQNTREGFFGDPVYGGNRDMVGWKMIGFPGARYDYREWIDKHNERFPLPPVGIRGRPEWSSAKAPS